MSTQTPATTQPKRTEITDAVLVKVNSLISVGELKLPSDYSPENALKSAYLILNDQVVNNKSVLETCTKDSIANCLFDMVIQGLSPVKKQCYFIPYGQKLTLQKSYTGNMALAKRVGGARTITANLIFEADKFEFKIDENTGFKKLVFHDQKLANIDINKIIGSYATVVMEDGYIFIELMTMKQIETSWMQGATRGNSPAHKNFRDEMAKKTVINRACKLLINSSSDADMYKDDEFVPDATSEKPTNNLNPAANSEEVVFEEVNELEENADEKDPIVATVQEEKKEEKIQPNLGF